MGWFHEPNTPLVWCRLWSCPRLCYPGRSQVMFGRKSCTRSCRQATDSTPDLENQTPEGAVWTRRLLHAMNPDRRCRPYFPWLHLYGAFFKLLDYGGGFQFHRADHREHPQVPIKRYWFNIWISIWHTYSICQFSLAYLPQTGRAKLGKK